MNFGKFARALPAVQLDHNVTDGPISLTQLPPNLLESLVPGYGVISQYAQVYLGFDISVIVTLGLLLFGLSKGGQYLFEEAKAYFRQVFMSSVHIEEHDDLFDMIMMWLAVNQGASAKRSVRAVTVRGSAVEDALDDSEENALDANGLFDYQKWSARTPPRYEPYYGRHMMWHNGTLFFFRRSQRQSSGRVQVSFGHAPEDDILQVDCIGRSTEPIRELIRSIRAWSLDRLRGTTTIRHPTPKDRARYGGSWSRTTARPSRPMDTVILDNAQKEAIIKDMNDYLHPASPKWYARRGIPYRRGYLFHGPPGTGKTSLSFALAGIFGLEIYAISLQEPTLTEGDLMMLFNGLSRRCIVLLEDIDAAGLIRDDKSDEVQVQKTKTKKAKKVKDSTDKQSPSDNNASETKDGEYTLKDFARELKPLLTSTTKSASTPAAKENNSQSQNQVDQRRQRAPGTGISLSGLLNAIDGVATHEGRVLIMTTNHPEKLDAALVRPGRVDRKVEFSLASKEQVEELFVRMYAASKTSLTTEMGNGSTTGSVKRTNENVVDVEKLSQLAREFTGKVPDAVFTPAEIQNLLMQYKTEPWVAVEEAEEWVKTMLEEKEKAQLAKETKDDDDDDDSDDDNENDDVEKK